MTFAEGSLPGIHPVCLPKRPGDLGNLTEETATVFTFYDIFAASVSHKL